MKRIKKAALILLTVCLTFSIIHMPNVCLAENKVTGTIDDLTWELDTDTGEMIVSGNGPLYSYDSSKIPWKDYRDNIKSVIIENGVTQAADFSYCKNLKSVKLADSVKYVMNHAFAWCSSLTDVDLGNSVEYMEGAFMYDTSLKSITVPQSCTKMYGGTFEGCSSLQQISLPDTMTDIGCFAFYGCVSLKSVTLPSSIYYVGKDAFTSCRGLTELTIPANVREIGGYNSDTTSNTVAFEDQPFSGCSKLATITILGKDTTIWDDAKAIPTNTAIKLIYKSSAEEYAKKYNRTYSYICVDGTENHKYQTKSTATCTQSGKMIYTCSACSYEYEKDDPATGHNPVTDEAITVTCVKDGLTEGSHCSKCGEILVKQETIKAPGHKKETRIITPATTTSEGKEEIYCTVCNEIIETRAIPKLVVKDEDDKRENIIKSMNQSVAKENEYKTDYKNFRAVSGLGCAKVAWTQDKSVSGYMIYTRSAKDKDYTLVRAVDNNEGEHCVLQNLQSCSIIQIKIVAYNIKDDKLLLFPDSKTTKIYVK